MDFFDCMQDNCSNRGLADKGSFSRSRAASIEFEGLKPAGRDFEKLKLKPASSDFNGIELKPASRDFDGIELKPSGRKFDWTELKPGASKCAGGSPAEYSTQEAAEDKLSS